MKWHKINLGENSVAKAAVKKDGTLDQARPWTTVKLESGRTLQVPTEQITRESDGTLSLPFTLEELGLEQPRALQTEVIPVISEELKVSKKDVPTGRLVVKSSTSLETHLLEEALLKESVEVEHVKVDREVAGPLPVRTEGDTTIIPLVEEVLVVQRRYVLREEVHIKRKQEEIVGSKEVKLKRQQVEIYREEHEA